MKRPPLSFCQSLVYGLSFAAVLACTPALASDPKKEPPKAEEKEFKYVNEGGVEGRPGVIYKRVEREKYDEPKPLPKEPPAPPPKPEPKEDDKKKDDKKKDDKKKDDGGEAKKEAKKEDKKKDDKKKKDDHAKKPEPPALSALYDAKQIKLDPNHRPFTQPTRSTKHADYYLCRGVLRDAFRRVILDEMNTFADRMSLPHAMEVPCMVKVAKPNTKFPGAIYVEFYTDDKAALACMKGGDCGATRLMMFYPRDKTGKKSKEIYRSYVLTDEKQYTRGAFCVSPNGQFLGDKNCYTALNPDWLFN